MYAENQTELYLCKVIIKTLNCKLLHIHKVNASYAKPGE